jgi:hypothetical protein
VNVELVVGRRRNFIPAVPSRLRDLIIGRPEAFVSALPGSRCLTTPPPAAACSEAMA